MFDLKEWIKKVSEWINNKEHVGFGAWVDIHSYTTKANAYTAPCDGMVRSQCRYVATNYVGFTICNSDGTQENPCQIRAGGSANTNIYVPIFKGQKVWVQANNGDYNTVHFVPYVKVGGVVRRLLNTLQSLAYRGGWCKC